MFRVVAALCAVWCAGYAVRLGYVLFQVVRGYLIERYPAFFSLYGEDPDKRTYTLRTVLLGAAGFAVYAAIAIGIALWLRAS